MMTLVTGGIRSGKSRFALELASQRSPHIPKCFLATAEVLDQEMKLRIEKHQEDRGTDFHTVEEPVYLAKAIEKVQNEFDLVLVDCLTLWINNLLFHLAGREEEIREEIEAFIRIVNLKKTQMIFVTNEVGWGLIPESPLVRRYTDLLGKVNQELAQFSDEVILMVAGIPNFIKESSIAKLDF